MAITYIVDEKIFRLSYTELKEKYLEFCEMEDEVFLQNVNKALHLACVICFFKEVPTYVCLSDTGIVHELAHILDDGTTATLKEIRDNFKTTLKLS